MANTSTQDIHMEINDRLDSRLDLALELTFPASDPISVYLPEVDDLGKKTVDAKAPRVVATQHDE
jgi:hypothetical protein